ncbi:hypothetical protein [Streptomyces coeruleorubidus]|uniref:Uncharacterized protein n=1 Tax=Streptomyces coeruleorubidus TaxID=116188 RepID=A0A5J6I8I9_STRC4|nr:hypothetical protein [Streptomyces coeruleorubidus]QEV28378.1 hypothetical protein CP976_32535 [Streptomyces coeruleorubidus]GGT59824.1 hypothetical protein GCM10010256_16340 [Streptomyces coeruleorubidus]
MRATFEDRLLDELKQEIRLRESAETGSADVTGEHEAKARLGRFLAPGRIAVVAAACAAAWLATVVVPGSPGDSKAYAMEPVGDDSVKLTVIEPSIGVAAQQELARRVRPWGIEVSIVLLPAGYVCERSKVSPVTDIHGRPLIPAKAGWDVTLRRGNVLAFENTRGDSRPRAVELYATKREAEPCVPRKVSLSDVRSGRRR